MKKIKVRRTTEDWIKMFAELLTHHLLALRVSGVSATIIPGNLESGEGLIELVQDDDDHDKWKIKFNTGFHGKPNSDFIDMKAYDTALAFLLMPLLKATNRDGLSEKVDEIRDTISHAYRHGTGGICMCCESKELKRINTRLTIQASSMGAPPVEPEVQLQQTQTEFPFMTEPMQKS